MLRKCGECRHFGRDGFCPFPAVEAGFVVPGRGCFEERQLEDVELALLGWFKKLEAVVRADLWDEMSDGWVSVEDGAVPEGVEVLVTDGRAVALCMLRGGGMLPVGFSGEEWGWDFVAGMITHWRLAPGLPGKEHDIAY